MFIRKSNTLKLMLTIGKSGLSRGGGETLIIVLLKKKVMTMIEHDCLLRKIKTRGMLQKEDVNEIKRN